MLRCLACVCVCHEMIKWNNSKTVWDIQMISDGFKQTKGGLSDGVTFAPLSAPQTPILGSRPHENREMFTAARRFEIFRWLQGNIANRGRAIRWYHFCPPNCPPKPNFGGKIPTTNTDTQMTAKRLDIEKRTQRDYSKPKAGYLMGLVTSRYPIVSITAQSFLCRFQPLASALQHR